MIQVKSHIASMSAYAPPWTSLDRKQYLRLDLNENTQPLPDYVNTALKELVDDKSLQMYPDYSGFLPKLSQYAQVKQNNIMITNGSDQAIDIILRTFLESGDAMLIAQPEFPIFTQFALIMGADIQGVPYNKDMSFPVEKFLNAVTKETRLIVIINPNNPTGTSLSLEQIKYILAENPELPVIVDEAYFEFTDLSARPLLESFPNLIITRTFSKAFAMAGLRLGYILASPYIISQLNKIRAPFDINSCALIAATAQLENPSKWKHYVHEVMNISKPFLENFFEENKISYYIGSANFMLVCSEQKDKTVNYLQKQGILVRPMNAPAIKNTFRISIGTIKEMQCFTNVFMDLLKNSRNNT